MLNRFTDADSPENCQAEDACSNTATSALACAAPKKRRRNTAWGDALRTAETEAQWRELIEHLPDNARQIWKTLNNLRQFWLVLRKFGGQSIRIPRTLPKDRSHALRQALGLACLRKLMATFGGTNLYVPRCTALMTRHRQHEIITGFSRSTGHGSSSTAAVSSLAQRHGISDRRVWQILKKESSVPPQSRLLLQLGDSAQNAASRHDKPV